MSADELFRTLKRAVTGSFEVLAELGRGPGGRNAFVAREVEGGGLVVLELNVESTDPGGTPSYGLYVRRELDASIPSLSLQCNQCGSSITGWARYCPNCDSDLSGVSHTTGGRTAAELLRTGQVLGQDRYELLGEMPRAEGGGAVYFALERATGRLVTLRMEKVGSGAEGEYTLGATQSMPAISAQGGAATPPAQPRIQWRGEKTTGAVPAAGAGATPGRAWGPGGTATPERAARDEAPAAVGAWYCPTCGAMYEAGIWFCPRDGSPVQLAAATDPLLGQTIAGRYRVLRKLGAGGMGTVYLAEHTRIGRPCALKIMNPALRGDPEALGRFGREAAHASRINHPNVAAIYDFGEAEDGTVYLAMEYAEGESLTGLMKREGAVTPARAGEIVRQVLDALGAAHALGIVHRDLKPDNIILATTPTRREAVKVVDFGIAKAIRATESQQLTRSGFVVGTPRYMSPEQITGETLDGRSDIYSAACILYELLVGASPFSGPSGEITIARRLSEPPPHPRKVDRRVGRGLDQVVVRALARKPGDRYATAEEFRDALVAATRPGITSSWSKGWTHATSAASTVARDAARAFERGGNATLARMGALGRRLVQGAHRARTTLGKTVASLAAGGGALGRTLRPLLSWKLATALVVLAVAAASAPMVLRWLTPGRGGPPPAASPAATSVQATGPAATPAPAPQPTGAVPAAVTPEQAAKPAEVAAQQPRPQGPVASGAVEQAPRPLPAQPRSLPATRTGTGPAGMAGAAAPERTVPSAPAEKAAPAGKPPAPTRAAPAATLDSLQAKLRLARLFAEREEYPDAFEQLRQSRGRLEALRSTYPNDASLRALRAEYASLLSSTATQCEAVRKLALGRGEEPPICR